MITPAAVRALRTASGLTQRQAADCLGLSYRTWQDWESESCRRPANPFLLELFAIVMLSMARIQDIDAAVFIRPSVWQTVMRGS